VSVKQDLTGVRESLTPKRRKRYTDNVQFAAAVARMIRAFGKRVGQADMEDLQELLELQEVLNEVTGEAVRQVRKNGGYSWTAIGRAAGMTRQAAHEKWSRP